VVVQVREKSVWRTLPSLRLWVLAAVVGLGCIVLGAASASAHESLPAQHTLSTTQHSALNLSPLTTVIKPVAVLSGSYATTSATALVKPVTAALKPVTVALRPVSAVLKSAAVAPAPVASAAALVTGHLPQVHEIVTPAPLGMVSIPVMSLVSGGANGARSTDLTPAAAVAPSPSPASRGHVESHAIPSFDTASPGAPALPLNAPWLVASGAAASGTGSGGQGNASADLTAGPRSSAAALRGTLRHDFWVVPRSLANDPSSSPD